ncbi:Aminoacylase-1 [Lamellibrachia satsuma]|nr:Aminoacylase-1 [Lamellibrachia satsuma]
MGTCLTPLDKDNMWWHAFNKSCEEIGIVVEPEIFPAATDGRYLRTAGIPVLGFSPINNTPILLHENNEYLNEDVFLRGIDIYCHLLPAIASVCPV